VKSEYSKKASALINHRTLVLTYLDGVSKPLLALNNLPTPSLLPIANGKVYRQDGDDHDNEQVASNSGIDTRTVCWCVFRPENQTSGNTTNTTEANKSRAAEGSLPLPADVVCLVGHAGWNVCVGTSSDQEDSEVLHSVALRISLFGVSLLDVHWDIVWGPYHNGQANQAKDGVENKNGATNVIFITNPSSNIHENSGEDVWWCDKALGSCHAEAHTFAQDDGQEVGNRIGHCSQTARSPSVTTLGMSLEGAG
jgi:hypothetical protein